MAGGAEQIPGTSEAPRFLGRSLKEGERIIAPTLRPDGTLRKPVRIRAGYVPQDEVAIYQSKGALLKKAAQSEGPPGYDPELDAKPKTKSAKRNERRKAKKHQAALTSTADDEKDSDAEDEKQTNNGGASSSSNDHLDSILHRMRELNLSEAPLRAVQPQKSDDISGSPASGVDLDKKIRAIKKKIRLAEQYKEVDPRSLKPEQLERLSKIEIWLEEVRLLESEKATPNS
ncbi:partner of Y14 and mago-like [Wolffia australiana]